MNAPLHTNRVHTVVARAFLFGAAALLTSESAVAQGNLGSDDRPVSQRLSGRQSSIAGRVGDLEKVLLRSSELEAAENPTRAALLRRAVQLSKQVQLANLLADTADKLDGQQYSDAIAQQQIARKNLAEILKLLQSENRSERVREEREQVRRWIEETDRLLRMQGALRGRTEGGQELGEAQMNQEQLEAKADEIADDLLGDAPDEGESREDEPAENSAAQQSGDPESVQGPSDASQSSGKPENDKQPAGEQDASSEPQQDEPPQGASEQGEPQQGEPQQGESQQGEPQEGEATASNPQEEMNDDPPKSATEKAGQRLRKAQQKMKEARQELKDAKRDGAIEKQKQAEQELREAVADLEQILKQLREEEIERSLASLESRLRSMLDMQSQIVEQTLRLNEISDGANEANRQVEIRASKLAMEEQKVLRAGERAYNLLREEGSSAAFPEAIEQVNADIADVAGRLSNGDVSQLTLVIEEDIVSALEEMVASLVAVQKENRENKKDDQQDGEGGGGGGQQGDRPLVNKLAELRLVKTLQIRINRRTDAMSKLLDSEDAKGQITESDVLEQVKELAERERKIQKVTLQVARDQNP